MKKKKAAGKKKKKATPAARAEAGQHLVVDVQKGGLKVQRSAPVGNAPRRALQPPFLDPRRSYSYPKPVAELVLDLLDLEGRVLESFAWPWATDAFFDRPAAEGGFEGGRRPSGHTARVLLVPVPKATVFYLFSRSDVPAGGEGAPRQVTRTALAIYTASSPVPPLPRLPFPAAGLDVRPLPGRRPLPEPR